MRVRRASLFTVATVVTTLVASSLPTGPALGAPDPGGVSDRKASGPTWSGKPDKRLPVQRRGADPEAAVALRKAPAVAWPAAGVAEVAVPRRVAKLAAVGGPVLARAGNLPVWVGPVVATSGVGTGPGRARVEVFDRATTVRAGVRGLLLRVGHTDQVERRMAVQVDYSGFRQAYGGDYGSRLALVRLPECALTAAWSKGCAAATSVPTHNSHAAGLLRAEVTDGLYAVTSASEGSAGSFRPTSLAPSATWQVGLQSGDFTWSYPVSVPTLPGQAPEISLSYSSGTVDGRVASTNNQPSWIGEGFDYQPGFVERSYKRCGEDGQAATIGDLCWASENAIVVLPGLTSELVRDEATGQWRAEQDSGWRVEPMTGAANGDGGDAGDQGEYWRLTSPDGTQYFFGRDQLPEATAGSSRTNSTWTVPVFGNQAGEPCNAATFDVSWCQQAYRWNLDFVIDRHGDAMSYWYAPETNYYGRNGRTDLPTPYVRGGQLSRIEYGQRVGSVYTTPAAGRVVFTPADRCVPGTSCVQSQPQNWPDVPWDQWCDPTSCPVLSPTFWSTKRLAKITTQVFSNGAQQDVDSWTLTQSYPVPGDNTPAALWLDSITHAGLVGGTTTLPAVTFDGLPWQNRVDGADTRPAMYKRRIGQIYTETGGKIAVTYAPTECATVSLPAVDSNQARCFPAIWGASPTEDWFHKYVVAQVMETDLVGGNPAKTTSYQYVFGGSGWHHDDAELVQDGRKSWGQWRGYQKVLVRTGEAGAARTLTEHVFMRGMNGDVNKDGTADQNVMVDGVPDEPMWRGFGRMVTVYDGDGGAMVSRTVSQPRDLGLTAQRPRAGGTSGALEAHLTDVEWERTETALAGGGTRTAQLDHTYDSRGRLTQTHDRGDLADPGDDTCAQLVYAENLTDWVINAVKQQVTLGVACGATPSYPADLISDKRFYHDGQTVWGAAPSVGDVTRVEEASSWSGGPVYMTTSRSEVDGHGRPVKQYDGLDHLTQTAYTPAVGGPVTQTVVTDALLFTNTTIHEPLRGSELATVNANNGTTTMAYDPLGRLTKVWQPGRATSAPSNVEYSYTVRTDGPNAVLTRTLLAGSTYQTSYELFDGFLRARQTQEPSPAGGRIVSDTHYDSYGRISAVLEPRHDPGFVASTLASDPTIVTAQTAYEYDGAGRQTAKVFLVAGEPVDRWRTATTYGGDRISVAPPAGDTARTEITDAHGRVVTLRQYTGGTPTGPYDETRYTYTKAGKLATVTDPAGNVWRYSYDLRGRQTQVQAPDTGVATTSYDAQGNVSTTTDARGKTLAYTYDALNRKTAGYDGSTAGTKLAEWTYDTATLGKGLSATAIRYSGGQAYENRVSSYDVRGRRLAATVVVPTAESGLAGTYPVTYAYNEADQVTSLGLPTVADVPAETLQYTYNSVGSPRTLTSSAATYAYDTTYTALGEPEQYVLGVGQQVIRDFGYEQGTRNLSAAITTTSEGAMPAAVGYEYNPAGNVTRMIDWQVGDDQCFRYDHLRRVTEAWTGTDGCLGDPDVAALGGPAAYWHSYRYDPTGNRTSEVQHAAGGDTTRTYSYPAAGAAQPHTLRSVTTAGPGGSHTDSYGYDGSGNTTARPGSAGATQSLVWDAEGHLASVTEGANTTSFLYDADGNRLIRRDPTASTLYLGDTELRVAGGVAKGTRYYRHNGEVVAVRTAGKLAWLVPDAHGTAGLSIDATTLAETRRYDLPFGAYRGPAAAGWPGDRGFVGGTADASTGLTHLGARDYDPGTGRFVSADPVVDHQDRQQVNGYAYASNNPATFTDADGRRVQIPAAYGSNMDRMISELAEFFPILRLVPLKLPSGKPTKKQDQCRNECRLESPKPSHRDSDYWPDVYPYFDVYPRNYGRDIVDSPVGSCYGGNPAPAIACGFRQDSVIPRVTYQSMERDCVGWNQCISPRPYEWVPVETYDDVPDYTSPYPLFGGGLLSRLLGSGGFGRSPGGSGIYLG